MAKAASAHNSGGNKSSLKTMAIILIFVALVGAAASFILLQRTQSTSSDASELACLNDTGTVECIAISNGSSSARYEMTISYVAEGQESGQVVIPHEQLSISQVQSGYQIIGNAQVPLKSAYTCTVSVTSSEFPNDPNCQASASKTELCTYTVVEPTVVLEPTVPAEITDIPPTTEPTTPAQITDEPTAAPTEIPTVVPGEPTYTPTPTSEPTNTPTNIPTTAPGEPTYTPTPTDTLIADGNGEAVTTNTPTPSPTSATASTATPTTTEILPETGIVAQLSFVVLLAGIIIMAIGFVI